MRFVSGRDNALSSSPLQLTMSAVKYSLTAELPVISVQ